MLKLAKIMTVGAGMMALAAICGCATGEGGKGLQWDLAIQGYSFRKDMVPGAIDKTKSLGVKYFEACDFLPVEPGMTLKKATPEVRKKLMRKLDQAGVKLINCYADLRQGEAGLRKTFECAKEMGIQTLVGEPDANQIPLLDKLTVEYGINVAIHNHPKRANKPEYVNWNPEEVMKMLKGCNKRMGTCPDIGHWARSGLDAVEALAKYEGRIICVHLKDVMKPEPPEVRDVPIGTGIANMKGCFAELARQKFSGILSIEYEHNPEDNMADVAQCVKFFNDVKKELGI